MTAPAQASAAIRNRAREIYQGVNGRITDQQMVDQLDIEGFKRVTLRTVQNWKKNGVWVKNVSPAVERGMRRVARARDIQALIAHAGGEAALLETVYGDMMLSSSVLLEKLLTWTNQLNAKSLSVDQSISLMKVLPGFIDRAVELRDKMSDLRFRGAQVALTAKGSDPKALDGEILPPEGRDGHGSGDKVDKKDRDKPIIQPEHVAPQLSDALKAIMQAKRDAPKIVKDVAPRQRNSTK